MKIVSEFLYRWKLNEDFVAFLKDNLPRDTFAIIKRCCWRGRMSSYFGFYENLEVSFSPAYEHLDTLGDLTVEQSNAFYEAFRVLKEKAPPPIKEAIRQFCHC